MKRKEKKKEEIGKRNEVDVVGREGGGRKGKEKVKRKWKGTKQN